MHSTPIFRALLSLGVALAAAAFISAQSPRDTIPLDDDWRFALGHATDPAQDFGHATGYFSYLAKTGYGDGPAKASFDDRSWRTVRLPHDWAVELPFAPEASHSHGYKAVGPGFPQNSVGWYRRAFEIPASDLGRRIAIEFDGIYRDAAVFVNGFFVGQEPSGYMEQSWDVSEYLNYGGSNVVAVRVDASMEEGWYYEGAGIYRRARIVKTNPERVQRHGTFIRTRQDGGQAIVSVETVIENVGRSERGLQVQHSIVDADGVIVATIPPAHAAVAAGGEQTLEQSVTIPQPRLWDLDTPHLYTLATSVIDEDGELRDRYETTFGVREIRFDPDQGFFLNGRHVKLKGTNNHQDHAGVGVAVPYALDLFRLRKLKEMGSNAYRASHHPASPDLLDACDRLGMLVIDENRLMGINDYHLGQLKRMMVAHRNHPSIILWSIGNEEWAIEGNVFGARITRVMQDFAKRIDATRPITAAISGGWGGISAEIEAMGFNYIRQGDTDKQHRAYPDRIMIGTEETTTQATRGIYVENTAKAHLAPLEDGSSGGNAESGWKHYAARDYTAGVFYWTGFDYRGEPTPYAYPAVLSQFGILDNCGFPKDSFHYLKSWWAKEPTLHIFPHWNWAGREGEAIEVRAHSNCEAVELFLNGESLGRQAMPINGHLSWSVPYQPGALEAHGYADGERILTTRVETTGPAHAIELIADRHAIEADGRDVSVVTVQIKDAAGRIVPTADNRIHFELEGPGRIIGTGNGNPSSLEPETRVNMISAAELGDWRGPDLQNTSEPVIFEASFDLALPADAVRAQLLLNAIGPETRAWLNGNEIAADALARPIDLDRSNTKPTGNVVRLAAKPLPYIWEREALQSVKPATLVVELPAAPHDRSAFNGLAQAIVQSESHPGSITLRARADGLEPAQLTIETEKVDTELR